MDRNKFSKYSGLILRVGLGFVFLWFGWSGMTNTEMWTGLVPAWTASIAAPEMLVRIHAVVELLGGVLLILGIQTQIVAIVLFLNLLHTITLLNYGPVMIRDIGLAAALLSIAVQEKMKK